MLSRLRLVAFTFLLFSLIPATLAADSLQRMTNAERLARGLPPNKPSLRRDQRMRARASATPPASSSSSVIASTTSSPLPTPSGCPKYGRILGSPNPWPLEPVSANPGSLQLSFFDTAANVTLDLCSPGPYNLVCTNCESDGAPAYLAACTSGSCMRDGAARVIWATSPTPLLSPSVNASFDWEGSGPENIAYQTAIWQYDNQTQGLTAQVVTDDGVLQLGVGFAGDPTRVYLVNVASYPPSGGWLGPTLDVHFVSP